MSYFYTLTIPNESFELLNFVFKISDVQVEDLNVGYPILDMSSTIQQLAYEDAYVKIVF